MFTGIIEELGHLTDTTRLGAGLSLNISAPELSPTLHEGDSVAVDGVCMTVEQEGSSSFTATAGPETLSRTTTGSFQKGKVLNLERAIAAGGRFGGHFVQGHVDGTTEVLKKESTGDFLRMTFRLPKEGANLVVEKGSVAVNGVSLTVSRLAAEAFSVDLVPFTIGKTNLRSLKPADNVNIEFDMLAKYVETMLLNRPSKGRLSLSFLEEHGFKT